jgi:2-dehydro-3-deoxyphosphogluconate aldolase/(4S)-4-hydroxy-2-oxoglutarate aldolase
MIAPSDPILLGKIIPVVTLQHAEDALPLADALAKGGIHTLEITLRTEAGLAAVRSVSREQPKMLIGAGTILSPAIMKQAEDAGAKFLVSPGITPRMLEAGRQSPLPYLPGVSTVSEIMLARESGFTFLKFFPAEKAGGVPMLKTLGTLFPDITFCPTGGVMHSNFRPYLSLRNVSCVGGSWFAPVPMIEARDWPSITRLAQACNAL